MTITPEQIAVRSRIAAQLAEAAQAEAARAAAATAPAGEERDATLRQASERLAQARRAVAELQAELLGPGTGASILERDRPVLLLPVRLEARVAWPGPRGWLFTDPGRAVRHLLVRIAPDAIHADSHEPALTDAEVAALRRFQKLVGHQPDAAWQHLATEVGPARALWVARQDPASATRRPPGWTRQAVARLMPDRWQVSVYVDGPSGRQRATALTTVCPDPVPLSADPLDPTQDPLAWVTSFEAAQARGLAVAVPLVDSGGRELTGDPVRVTAVGVVARLGPDAAAASLANLIDAHHMSSGVRVTVPGDPTTSSVLGPAVTARRDSLGPAILDAEQQRGEGFPEQAPINLDVRADRLAVALGTTRLGWRVLPGALGPEISAERDLRTIVAAAIRPVLAELIDPGLVDAVLGQYTQRLEATGPLPVLLVGSQPYGVLPVLPQLGQYQSDPIMSTVESVRQAWWEPAVERVPRLGRIGQDSTVDLIGALGRDGAPHRFGARVGVNGVIAAQLSPYGSSDPMPALVAAFGPNAGTWFGGLRDVLMHAGTVPLSSPVTVLDLRAKNGPLVEPSGYLDALSRAPLLDIIVGTPGIPTGVEAPLLYQFARAALIATVDQQVRDIAIGQTGYPAQYLPGWSTPVSDSFTENLWVAAQRAGLGIDAHRTIVDMLNTSPTPPIAQLRAALGVLANLPVRMVDAMFRHVLGLAARIDPWYTAVAWQRLIDMRDPTTPARYGVHIGGYGVLEGFLPRAGGGGPDGYVHAPGAAQAVTAAVLHAAHRQRYRDAVGLPAPEAEAMRRSTAIALDSTAVRVATGLLDGLRTGHGLGELLGARIEERLVERGRQALLAPLRQAFPTAQGPTAAGAVVDGLAVLEASGFPGDPVVPAGITTDPAAVSDLTAALDDAATALDALGDLLLAEGVHQLAAGRFGRSASVADFAAAIRTGVPQPELPTTDRRATGRPVRVLVTLPASSKAIPGWPETPRTRTAPELAAWAAAVLPAPERVVVWVELPEHGGLPAGSQYLRLVDLLSGLDPADPCRFGPLDVLAAADGGAEPGTALYARLETLATRYTGRPAVPDPRYAQGLSDEDRTVAQLLYAAAQVNRAFGAARALTPADLGRPGEDPGVVADYTELATRAQSVLDALHDAAATVAAVASDPGATVDSLRAALLDLDLYGIRVAVPDQLEPARAAARTAAAEAIRRHGTVPGRPGASEELPGWAATALEAVYGSSLPVGPVLSAGGHPIITTAPPATREIRAALARAATVRPQVRGLQLVDLLAAAAGSPATLQAVRLPAGPWSASPGPAGSVDLLAVIPAGPVSTEFTGVIIDEWTETVPQSDVHTALTFHQPAPSASPPQLLLLAVPPPSLEQWSLSSLELAVDEALHLARLRAVELADLGPNQLLPPLLSSSEPPGPTAVPVPPDGLAPTGLNGV